MSKIKIFSGVAVVLAGLLFVGLFTAQEKKEDLSFGAKNVQTYASSTNELPVEEATVAQKQEKEKAVATAVKTENKKARTITSCDFPSMRKYLSSLLLQPAWDDILSEYTLQQYKEIDDTELEVFVNGLRPHVCVLELALTSAPFDFTEFHKLQYPYYDGVSHVLSLFNPLEDYSVGAFNFHSDTSTEFTFALADGPNSSSYSTYQFNQGTNAIRLFAVSGGTKREKSPYEVTKDEDMCPCEQVLSIRMTDEILVADFSD